MRNIKLTTAICLLCVSTNLFTYPTLAENEHSSKAAPAVAMIPASFADLAEALSPAVVNISSTQKTITPNDFPEMPEFPEGSPFEDFFEEFMGRRGKGKPRTPAASLGSGFIIDADKGYIVTNNHVIRDAESVQITLTNDVTIDAEIIGTDEKTDIAVLKIDATPLNLTAASFGNSDNLRVGDWTLVIGNPFGLGGSVTAGILSARARDISSGPYDDYLQTDASINRGNSGGPLFDMSGKVIGINTAIFSPTGGSVGIGFSIPSNLAKPVINQIIKYGRTRRGWLGVRVQKVTEEIAESLGLEQPTGALIASVNTDGPAHIAGLKAGDIILEINDQKIQEMKSLPRIIAENDINTTATVTFWRDNKEHSAEVLIGELEKAEDEGLITDTLKSSASGIDIDSLGLTLKTIEDDLRDEYSIDKSIKGVFISAVKHSSEADSKGLAEGDVIVELNQQPISEPQEVIDIIEKAIKSRRKSVLALINSNGRAKFVALRLKPE